MSERRSLKVMIVDDHPIVRSGLAALVSDEEDMLVVAQAGSAAEAIEMFTRYLPDVSLVDLVMPGKGGIELISQLRRLSTIGRFLILTAYAREGEIHRAMEVGASGYVLKDASNQELMGAIRVIAEGGRYLPPDCAGLTPSPGQMWLTPREREVLRLLARGESNCQIASHLGVSDETVKTYVKHLFSKLDVHSRSQAILTGVKMGLVVLEA